jgi:hypothetical protein
MEAMSFILANYFGKEIRNPQDQILGLKRWLEVVLRNMIHH